MALNAAAGLWIHGIADDLADGLATARDVLRDGAALDVLHRWVATSQDAAA